jgi:NAD(P)-dependent dehydrogenase (short-subunit alcohol dehydrogenase family)
MACRNQQKGEKALSEIESTGIKGTLSFLHLDIEDDTSIAKAVDKVTQDFGRVDVFVSNAGTAAPESSGRELMTKIFSTNVISAMLVMEAFLPLLLKSPKPYIIQVSSGLGSMSQSTDPSCAHYAAGWDEYRMSKAALNMMTVQMHKRLQGQVRVFAFCPGLVRSNLRGESEAAVNAQGMAGDPLDSGRGILGIVTGERDGEVGQFVHKDGIWQW